MSSAGAAKPRYRINPPVFFTSVALVMVLVGGATLWPQASERVFAAVQGWVIHSAGWFYVLAVAGFLVFVVALAASRYGAITPTARFASTIPTSSRPNRCALPNGR